MTLGAGFLRSIEAIVPVRADEPLSRHTTIGVGGPADAYVVVTDAGQLAAVTSLCLQASVPFFVLGSGSNIVVGDQGIRGVVIENNAQAKTEPAAESPPSGAAQDESAATMPQRFLVRAESGCSFAAIARQLAFAGYAGLEWACGIPGTIGGAVVYNAGAYGGCLGDVLQRVALAGADGEAVIKAADLGLVYRGSDFTRGLLQNHAVLWAEFDLWSGEEQDLRARVADYDQRRLKAQPRGRNAGSFFKNPPERPAWKLLDGVGLRGHRIGGAEFSERHCNFLINIGNASAADVAGLKHLAQTRVRDQFGIELESEVTLVGQGFDDQNIGEAVSTNG